MLLIWGGVPMPGLEYDTLTEDDASSVNNIIDLYQLVLGEAMDAGDLCGVLTTGPIDQSPAQSASWGGVALSFANHSEVWHVRSAPKGRMGHPLASNEVRKISVLIRKSGTQRGAQVTNIKLWRLPDSEKLTASAKELYTGNDVRQRDRGSLTYGALGIAMHGINLFENRSTKATTFSASNGCNVVLSAVASISRESDGVVCKIEASMTPHYVVAASLAGFKMNDVPGPRSCEEEYSETSWDRTCEHNATRFRSLVVRSDRLRYALKEDTALKLIFTAEDIFEQLSHIGYLDMRADPFLRGSLPDDLNRPCGLALILAIAVRVACYPEKWGLPPTCCDDAFATKEAALFVESIMPSVLSMACDGVGGEQSFSVDIVSKIAQSDIGATINGLRTGNLVGKHRNLDHVRMERSVKQTMRYLYCAGIAVCGDLFGLGPKCVEDSTAVYTRYGLASHLLDPMTESRTQSGYAVDLGNVVSRWPTLRTSTRGQRQIALAGVLVEVDSWLRTGKHNGATLSPQTQAPNSVRPEELNPCVAPVESLRESAPLAVAGVPRSAKKKKRVDVLLAERARVRNANHEHYANEAVRSLFKPGSRNDKRIASCSEKLCSVAINKASGIFGDVLQLGGCGGPSVLFNFTSYSISPTSAVLCAHCENRIHVVQSIAFAGSLGVCAQCGHPRCLKCVEREMREGERVANCHFCCGA